MLRSIILAAAMTLLSAPVMSAATTIPIPETDEAIIVPQGSPLHFRAAGPGDAVEFKGAIELSGTWYYGDNDFNDSGAFDPTVYFVPDSTSFARLPQFKQRGQPRSIYFTNVNAFLKAVVPNKERAKAKKERGKYLSGHLDLWVDKFEAGIECDAPYFYAHFLHVVKPLMRVALSDLPDVGC